MKNAQLLVCLLAVFAASAAFSQSASPQPNASAEAPPQGNQRSDQAIERIRIEDAGSRVDEVRVGGETQSISVQPKTGSNFPAYEVNPSATSRGGAPSRLGGDTNGSRVWNVLTF
jgi:hypothetical protein